MTLPGSYDDWKLSPPPDPEAREYECHLGHPECADDPDGDCTQENEDTDAAYDREVDDRLTGDR